MGLRESFPPSPCPFCMGRGDGTSDNLGIDAEVDIVYPPLGKIEIDEEDEKEIQHEGEIQFNCSHCGSRWRIWGREEQILFTPNLFGPGYWAIPGPEIEPPFRQEEWRKGVRTILAWVIDTLTEKVHQRNRQIRDLRRQLRRLS